MEQTGWKIKVRKAPHIASSAIQSIYYALKTGADEREKFYRDLGETIFRPRYTTSEQVTIKMLGAAQEVGRSCLMVETSESKVLLDAGIHPGARNSVGRLSQARLGRRAAQRARRGHNQPRPPRPHGLPPRALQVRLRGSRLLHRANAAPDDAATDGFHQDRPDRGRQDTLRPEGHQGHDPALHHLCSTGRSPTSLQTSSSSSTTPGTYWAQPPSTCTSARGSTTSSTRATTSTEGPSSSTRRRGTTRGSRRSSPRAPTGPRRTSCHRERRWR